MQQQQQHRVDVKTFKKDIFSDFSWMKLPNIDINVGVVESAPGMVQIAQSVLGLICLSVISRYCQFYHPLTGSSLGFFCSNSATFFLMVTYSCFVTSVILLLCCLFSYFTSSFLPKTVFEFSYHAFASAMYMISSLTLLVTVVTSNSDKGSFKEPAYDAKIAASALGLMNSILYGVSTYFSFSSRRQLGQSSNSNTQ